MNHGTMDATHGAAWFSLHEHYCKYVTTNNRLHDCNCIYMTAARILGNLILTVCL